MIDTPSRVLGIIGNPVMHTLSPIMHNALFASLNLPYVYAPFLVNNLEHAIAGIRALNFLGASITIPFKETALPFLDAIDPAAAVIGSVNTIVNENGRLIGTNTDAEGALRALKEKTAVSGKRTLILGAGGSARAVMSAIMRNETPSRIAVAARNADAAHTFVNDIAARTHTEAAEPFDIAHPDFPDIAQTFDIIVNTTPVGMYPNENESPLPERAFRKSQIVFDIVYRPMETETIRRAKKQKATIVYGATMLLYQAALQFEQWTNMNASIPVMKRALLKALKNQRG